MTTFTHRASLSAPWTLSIDAVRLAAGGGGEFISVEPSLAGLQARGRKKAGYPNPKAVSGVVLNTEYCPLEVWIPFASALADQRLCEPKIGE